MEIQNKNLPAFPHEGYKYATNKPEGLSKREYFAGLAMQGMLANPKLYEIAEAKINPDEIAEFYALCATEHADALLNQISQ